MLKLNIIVTQNYYIAIGKLTWEEGCVCIHVHTYTQACVDREELEEI